MLFLNEEQENKLTRYGEEGAEVSLEKSSSKFSTTLDRFTLDSSYNGRTEAN